ncbi:MAG: LysR family transcriptional regulator [Campylobacteraceae bacterium]|nr:LysR family transcriptional regulator [Campylobacteraceae bacterium]
MDSNLLKIFVEVAKFKSISLAAKELEFAQSNVSSRIKQLEKNIGHELFHRIPKGVILTKAGEKLFDSALEIVRKIEETTFSMKNLQKQESLKVGSTESNAVLRIVPFLVNLHKDFPKMQLELFTGTTDEMIKDLLEYKVDIAFVSGIPLNKELKVLNHFDEHTALFESKIGNIPNVLLILRKGCRYSSLLQDHYKKMGNSNYKVLEFGSYNTILGCVKAGMGKTLLPIHIVKKLGYEKDLKRIDLNEDLSNIPTCLICRKNYVPSISEYLINMELKNED